MPLNKKSTIQKERCSDVQNESNNESIKINTTAQESIQDKTDDEDGSRRKTRSQKSCRLQNRGSIEKCWQKKVQNPSSVLDEDRFDLDEKPDFDQSLMDFENVSTMLSKFFIFKR